MRPRTLVILVSLSALAACQSGQRSVSPFDEPISPPPAPGGSGWSTGGAGEGAPLYGFDGSPVGSMAPGGVERRTKPIDRTIDDGGGSRLVLLELYQQAVEERDELLLELEALDRALDLGEERTRGVENQLAAMLSANQALEERMLALEAENTEVAARLATAQIRRLEAEKAWLEAAVEWERRDRTPEQENER